MYLQILTFQLLNVVRTYTFLHYSYCALSASPLGFIIFSAFRYLPFVGNFFLRRTNFFHLRIPTITTEITLKPFRSCFVFAVTIAHPNHSTTPRNLSFSILWCRKRTSYNSWFCKHPSLFICVGMHMLQIFTLVFLKITLNIGNGIIIDVHYRIYFMYMKKIILGQWLLPKAVVYCFALTLKDEFYCFAHIYEKTEHMLRYVFRQQYKNFIFNIYFVRIWTFL